MAPIRAVTKMAGLFRGERRGLRISKVAREYPGRICGRNLRPNVTIFLTGIFGRA